MSHPQTFSNIIQGEGTLLIQCADVLLARGHSIAGVISTHDAVQDWANAHQIPCYDPKDDIAAKLQGQPFDYFWSIANLRIIADSILALPRKAAINFHDGPLPRYAGLYATSHALLHHESTHGVTWHIMEAKVDTGDILKQQTFPITPGETAFTLNAKCYEHGVASFAELVDELAEDRVTRQPQPPEPESYFGRYDRPPAAGRIDWTRPAADIDALVRALDFGPYANPLTRPKLAAGDAVYVVPRLTVTHRPSTAAPGTIVTLNDERLEIATSSQDVTIYGLADLNGAPVTLAEFAVQTDLAAGHVLPALSAADADALTELNRGICRHETFWLRRLQDPQPAEIPYADHSSGPAKQRDRRDMAVSGGDAAALVAALGLYLARVSGQYRFDLGLYTVELAETIGDHDDLFAPVVPLRVMLDPAATIEAAQGDLLAELDKVRQRQTYALDMIARYPELKDSGVNPAQSVVVALVDDLNEPAPPGELVVLLAGDQSRWVYDASIFKPQHIEAMQHQFSVLLDNLREGDRGQRLDSLALLSAEEQRRVMVDWNATAKEYDRAACLHTLFERQAQQHPENTAAVFENQSLTYAELDRRANQLAHDLRGRGVGPDDKVGLYVERSLDMMVALLGILKAGGAYVPLDPTYPQDRIAFMVADAGVQVLVTQERLLPHLPEHQAEVVCVDRDWPQISQQPETAPESGVQPNNLAYVIYTSGSTGKPKGVMIEHRNVINFFAGMDDFIPHKAGDSWLAVTSLSFDISVLEVFWTLAHGFKVVIYADTLKADAAPRPPAIDRDIDFSLFYFASYRGGDNENKYHLLLEGAKFADEHGFAAVWTPERHFGDFGGLYPNPAITNAALAAMTKNIHLRAGSLVSPLHSPVSIAEDWALVDNLSNGRVGISFAAGWQPRDFVLMPENFADRKDQMFRDIEAVHTLWRGDSITLPGPIGDVEVRTLPRPVQAELPTWITIAGNPETFRMAGEGGYRILTHLLGQSIEELTEKLAIYHQAWRDAGHAGRGYVTLMLHTFVGDDVDEVREIVRQPMIDYLGSALSLTEQAAWSFPTFKDRAEATGMSLKQMFEQKALTDDEKDAIFNHAFERYFETSGLFGDADRCLDMVNQLKAIGVDEIGCLIDFGVPTDLVLDHLDHLNHVRELAQTNADTDFSIPAQIERHNITHMQCTPSMADMLTINPETAQAFTRLQTVMVGGEAFPIALANKLLDLVPGKILNMYGPTETTIWSAVHPVATAERTIPIGRPIANTSLYILDERMQPVPVGATGELFIGGDGVVRGYWNRPELTAERFISDPFSRTPGARMYRTGDLARYLPDGNVEFLGRNDFQVKIRGYRIELGEIELLLDQHPGIQKSVVVARDEAAGDKRLAAYMVPVNGGVPSAELRDYLNAQLPDFMVPAYYVTLDTFPLTPNKKIDRKALPAPDQVQAHDRAAALVPPQNDLERQIAEIWQTLLGMPSVGVHDNFFDLGGHSILAVQAHRLISEITDRPLSITDLFRFTTIHTLANYLGADDTPAAAQSATLDQSLSRAERRKQRFGRR